MPEGALPGTGVVFEGVTPIFRVRRLEASIDHYVSVLGFSLDWREPGVFASVSRGRCGVYLCQEDQGHAGTWAWIGVSNIEPLLAEYQAKGAKVRNPPTNYPWAYEMQIEDPDGHVLRFGSEPRADLPFGPWRDMRGDLWQALPDGGWEKVGR
jgi:predicted enzyme related to lactoylglutathione lyase